MPHPRGENLSGIHWYLVKPLVTVSPHFIAAGAFSCFHRCRVGASNATAQAATAPRSRRVDRNGLIQNTLGAQARLSRTGGGVMGIIVIDCPSTGRAVSTGIEMLSIERLPTVTAQTECPVCG